MVKLSQVDVLKAKYRYYKYRCILLENGLIPIELPIKTVNGKENHEDDIFSDITEEDAPLKKSDKEFIKKTIEKPNEQTDGAFQVFNSVSPLEKYNMKSEDKLINKKHFLFHGDLFPYEEMNEKIKAWPEIAFEKALPIVLEFHDYKTRYQKTDPNAKVCETNDELKNDIYKQFTFWFSNNVYTGNNKNKEDNKYSWTKHICFGDYISRETFETIFSSKNKYEQLLKELKESKNKTNENDSKPVNEYENKILDIQKQIASPNKYFLNSGFLMPYDQDLFPGLMYMSFDKDSYATFAENFDKTNPFDHVEDWSEINYDDAKDAVLNFLDLHLKNDGTLPFLTYLSSELLNDPATTHKTYIMMTNENAFKSLFAKFIMFYNINRSLSYPPNGVHIETFKKIIQEKYQCI